MDGKSNFADTIKVTEIKMGNKSLNYAEPNLITQVLKSGETFPAGGESKKMEERGEILSMS
jgi:hypothetical protein